MAKKIETRTIHVCDVGGCDKEVYSGHCLGCGIDYCYSHDQKLGVAFYHSTSRQGHGDGYYCHECANKLRASGEDPLFNAYLVVKELREELEAFHEDFEIRTKSATDTVMYLYESRIKRVEKE